MQAIRSISSKNNRLPTLSAMIRTSVALILCLVIMLTGCSPTLDEGLESPTRVEQLIAGGLVYDGSGGIPYVADLGIKGGKIVFIGDAEVARIGSDDTIDVTGLWVAPGFIDAHSHAELDRDYGRDALPYLYQGITSVVLGVDGGVEPWQATGPTPSEQSRLQAPASATAGPPSGGCQPRWRRNHTAG